MYAQRRTGVKGGTILLGLVGTCLLLAGCAPATQTPSGRALREQERADLISTAVAGITSDCSSAMEIPDTYPPELRGYGGMRFEAVSESPRLSDLYIYLMEPSQEAADAMVKRFMTDDRMAHIRKVHPQQADVTLLQLHQIRSCMNQADWNGSGAFHAIVEGSLINPNIEEQENRIVVTYFPVRPGVRQAIQGILAGMHVPLQAVDVRGCPVGYAFTPPTEPRLISRELAAIQKALDFHVEAPHTVRPGETVQITLVLKNITDHMVTVEYGTNGVVITDTRSKGVWGARCNVGSILVGHGYDFKPGEELTFPFTWSLADNQSDEVAPGDYDIYGIFDILHTGAAPAIVRGWAAPPVRITVLPD